MTAIPTPPPPVALAPERTAPPAPAANAQSLAAAFVAANAEVLERLIAATATTAQVAAKAADGTLVLDTPDGKLTLAGLGNLPVGSSIELRLVSTDPSVVSVRPLPGTAAAAKAAPPAPATVVDVRRAVEATIVAPNAALPLPPGTRLQMLVLSVTLPPIAAPGATQSADPEGGSAGDSAVPEGDGAPLRVGAAPAGATRTTPRLPSGSSGEVRTIAPALGGAVGDIDTLAAPKQPPTAAPEIAVRAASAQPNAATPPAAPTLSTPPGSAPSNAPMTPPPTAPTNVPPTEAAAPHGPAAPAEPLPTAEHVRPGTPLSRALLSSAALTPDKAAPAEMNATVLPRTGPRPLLASPIGTLALVALDAPEHSTVRLRLLDAPASLRGTRAPAEAAASSWRALAELVAGEGSPAAMALRDDLHPRNPPRLAAALLYFTAVLRREADPLPALADALAATGKAAEMMPAIGAELEDLRRLAENPKTGDWQSYVLPFGGDGPLSHAHLFVRRDAPKREAESDGGRRFVLEVETRRQGAIEFDGLVRRRRFDLLLRSRRPFAPEERAEIAELFRSTLDSAGWAGDIGFATASAFAVSPLAKVTKGFGVAV